MENFFTRVKDRTTDETWVKGRYGTSPRGCLAGLMGWRNSYVFQKMSEQDRAVRNEAYNFANRWLMVNKGRTTVEVWNDQHAKSLADVHQVLDELAVEWEKLHPSETEAMKKAKAWLADCVTQTAQKTADAAWALLEVGFGKVDEKPMYSRFADNVEDWLEGQPIEEKEKIDA